MLISLVFSVLSNRRGQERDARPPLAWTIEICNAFFYKKNLRNSLTILFTVHQYGYYSISEDVRVLNNSLESSIAEVKSAKCTSPLNLSVRSIVFIEILPAFRPSDGDENTVYFSSILNLMRILEIKITSKICNRSGSHLSRVVSSTCILWLHRE